MIPRRRVDFPYIDDFCDDEAYVFSTIGQGPKGEKGDRGDDGTAVFPTFADPIEWDRGSSYDANVLVYHDGRSYISKRDVPSLIDITDTQFWAIASDWNAQTEELRQEVEQLSGSVNDISALIPIEDFGADHTVKDHIENIKRELASTRLDFINVKEYGAKGDGVTDDFPILQQCLTEVKNAGGGVVYFPAGTYVVMNSLCVGPNTIITGDGEHSVLYGKGDFARFGTCVGVHGSNVIIEKVNGKYDTDVFRQPGANVGFIGISNYTFESALVFCTTFDVSDLMNEEHFNIVVQDIVTDCHYPVQTECSLNATANMIHDVIYHNIIARKGVVSWQANVEYGVTDVFVDNVICAEMRSNPGYLCRAYVTNCKADVGRLHSGPTYVSNSEFRYRPDSVMRDWIANGYVTDVVSVLSGHGIHLSNVLVDGCGDMGSLSFGLNVSPFLSNSRNDRCTLFGVKVVGVNSGQVVALENTANKKLITTGIGCSFGDASNTTQTPCQYFHMSGSNIDMPALVSDKNTKYIYIDNMLRTGLLTDLRQGLSVSPDPMFAFAVGNMLYIQGAISSTSDLPSNAQLFKLHPSVCNGLYSCQIAGTVMTASNVCYPCVLYVSAGGVVSLGSSLTATGRYIYVSGCFPINLYQ